jgi:hypothetical protein
MASPNCALLLQILAENRKLFQKPDTPDDAFYMLMQQLDSFGMNELHTNIPLMLAEHASSADKALEGFFRSTALIIELGHLFKFQPLRDSKILKVTDMASMLQGSSVVSFKNYVSVDLV